MPTSRLPTSLILFYALIFIRKEFIFNVFIKSLIFANSLFNTSFLLIKKNIYGSLIITKDIKTLILKNFERFKTLLLICTSQKKKCESKPSRKFS